VASDLSTSLFQTIKQSKESKVDFRVLKNVDYYFVPEKLRNHLPFNTTGGMALQQYFLNKISDD
jgi:hypothetical protein